MSSALQPRSLGDLGYVFSWRFSVYPMQRRCVFSITGQALEYGWNSVHISKLSRLATASAMLTAAATCSTERFAVSQPVVVFVLAKRHDVRNEGSAFPAGFAETGATAVKDDEKGGGKLAMRGA